MIAHGPENVFYCGWGNLRRGGAVPPGADLYGLASHDRRLVGTDVGELDRPRRRWWPRKEKTVVLYCASGGRSALAGKTLQEFGYKSVYNAGAFKDLAEAGLETEPA